MRLPVCLVAPFVLLALVVLVLGTPSISRADDALSAREHYQKGTSYYDLGKYPEAIREFEAAYQMKNDPALLYNLAQSNRLAGNSEQALHFYRTYLRYVPKAANRSEIEDRIKQLEQLIAQKNTTQTTPPNQTLPPGGAPPVMTPPPVETPPVMTAPPPAAEPPPGQTPDQAYPGVTTPVPPHAPNDHHKMIRAGEITAIAGGALFIVGAAYGAAAVGASNDVKNQAMKGQAFDPSIEQRGKDAQKNEAIFMTLGVLTAATGGVLYILGRHLASREASASVAPMASSHGAGLSVQGTF